MRGKCESCEFYSDYEYDPGVGTCHIRSVEKWPVRLNSEGCGEHQERLSDEEDRQREEMRRATNDQRFQPFEGVQTEASYGPK